MRESPIYYKKGNKSLHMYVCKFGEVNVKKTLNIVAWDMLFDSSSA